MIGTANSGNQLMGNIRNRLAAIERGLPPADDSRDDEPTVREIIDALHEDPDLWRTLADMSRHALMCRHDGDLDTAELLEASVEMHQERIIHRLKEAKAGTQNQR